MKPRIGMLIRMKSGDNHYVIGQSDINAVKNAGGLPVLIPVMSSTEDIPEQVDEHRCIIYSRWAGHKHAAVRRRTHNRYGQQPQK